MIEKAFNFTRDVFNQYLTNKFGLDEDVVLINRIVSEGGSAPIENTNKVILSLIHIEQETNQQYFNKSRRTNGGNYIISAAPQCYNLYVLVVPHFEDYNEGLKFLNSTLEFFQTNSMLNNTISSNIPEGITKLEFQLEKGDGYMQMQNLWTALGAKFQPSIIYKMKLISIDSQEIDGFNSKVSEIANYAVER